MQIRILICVAVIALIGWFIFSSSDGETEEAERLARQRAKETNNEPADSTQQVSMVRLPNELLAEWEDELSCWIVDGANVSRVQTPYRPDQGPQESTTPPAESDNPGFVGAAACAECHQKNHDGFVHTAHHKTSEVVTPENFNWEIGENSSVATDDPGVSHKVVRHEDKYYQAIDFHGWQHKAPMQVVTGSSKAGQTYLYWHGDGLFQTHLSYASVADQWIPSPGFTATDVDLTRVVRTGCLECHITYIQRKSPPNYYHKETAIWGISCERCHGPGREHIEFHQQNPQDTVAKYITQPADLDRQRQLDICGQCHSGSFRAKQSPFSFRPGDDLREHHRNKPAPDKVGSVHTSNQLSRLQKSACFQHTEMTCTTCHNPHQNERGNTLLFSQGCLKCHQTEHCGMADEIGETIGADCINCHMPMTEDRDMPLETRRGTVFPAMVDHHIRVDREATKKFLAQ